MMKKRTAALPKDLKQKNLEELLRLVVSLKQFTIAEIADISAISRQTVTKAMSMFVEKGILVSGEKSSSTSVGGRKPATFMMNPVKYAVAIHQYGKKFHFGLLNLARELIDEINLRYGDFSSYEDYLQLVCQNIDLLLSRNSISRDNLLGIILDSGGIIDEIHGTADLSGHAWGIRCIRKDIQELLLHTESDSKQTDSLQKTVRVEVGNVAKIAASSLSVDISMFGKRIAAVYIDHGVGITLINDGEIQNTRHNITGELGHMILDLSSDKTCSIGDRGCFEALISEKCIRDMAEELPEEVRKKIFCDYDEASDFREQVLKKSEEGLLELNEIVDYMAEVIGSAFVNLAFAFDPDCFLIQGSFVEWPESFKEKIRKTMKKNYYLREIDFAIESSDKNIESMMDEGGVSVLLQKCFE